MKTELEQEFFKTFGIEPKIKDGCKYADNYWNNERLANLYGTFDAYLKEKCPYDNKECYTICSYSYDKEVYPEITDSKLLEMICILNKEGIYGYSDWGGNFVIGETVEELKESILTDCIRNKSKIFNQIQQLFKEEE